MELCMDNGHTTTTKRQRSTRRIENLFVFFEIDKRKPARLNSADQNALGERHCRENII